MIFKTVVTITSILCENGNFCEKTDLHTHDTHSLSADCQHLHACI